MIVINGFQHRPVIHKRTDTRGVHKESPFPGSLESETELDILEIKETAESINHTGSRREPDVRGIIHVNHTITVYITITDVSRHNISSLGRGVVDFRLIAEKAFGNITDLL